MLKILYIIFILSGIYWLYFAVTAVGVFKKKKDVDSKKDDHNFFGIIIAARNEEIVIGNLVKSLKNQNYPKDCFEIFVVPNNCTDNTDDVAKKAGATILECTEKVKSKGEVLKYTFNKLANNKKIDAYVIFDADNIVHPDFLSKMNDTINMGYPVAQGFRDSKNISDNWITTSYAIMWYIQNLFLNQSRHKLGKSSFLNGTGIMIKKEVIDKYGFDVKTITEDIEFEALCAINDQKIAFVEDAIIYDEQVSDIKTSLTQRKRWSFGAIECLRGYFLLLMKKGFKDRKFECFDITIFYLATFMQVLFSLLFIILFIYTAINIDNFLVISLWLLLFIYIILILFRMFLLKKYDKNIKDNLAGILLFDLFAITWVPVNFVCLFMKKCEWSQIKHDRNMNI